MHKIPYKQACWIYKTTLIYMTSLFYIGLYLCETRVGHRWEERNKNAKEGIIGLTIADIQYHL